MKLCNSTRWWKKLPLFSFFFFIISGFLTYICLPYEFLNYKMYQCKAFISDFIKHRKMHLYSMLTKKFTQFFFFITSGLLIYICFAGLWSGPICIQRTATIMVLILHGNSDHFARTWRKTDLSLLIYQIYNCCW